MSWKVFYPDQEFQKDLYDIWVEARKEHEKEQDKARKENRPPAPYDGPKETHTAGENGAGVSTLEWKNALCKDGTWHHVRVTVIYSYGSIISSTWETEDSGVSCLHARPLPPDMDEDHAPLSVADTERIWRQFLLEQDMAKRKKGPIRSHTVGIPDDFIDKVLGPYIRPTGLSVSNSIKSQLDTVLGNLVYSDLYRDPDSVEKALPPGSGPDPIGPEEYLKPRSTTLPSGWNPIGPKAKTAKALPDD